jgi:hypothetical protein
MLAFLLYVFVKEIWSFAMEDDRFECPTRDQLIAALDKLLETPRAKSAGGWAEVSMDRMWEMDGFFRLVRKAVMEPDPDGHMVITWDMLNRKLHRNPASGFLVPHRMESKQDTRDYISAAKALIGSGEELLRLVDFKLGDEIREERRLSEAAQQATKSSEGLVSETSP